MTQTFYFYYVPGNFPDFIVNKAYTLNPVFEIESYKMPSSELWTLKIMYESLSDEDIENMVLNFQDFSEYDGWGDDENCESLE